MTMYDDDRVVTLLRDIAVPAAPPDRLGSVSRRARSAETRRSSVVAGSMALVLVGGIIGAVSLHGRSNEQVLTVADAARTTQDAGSARLTIRLAITHSTSTLVPSGDLMTLSGPVDFRRSRYSLTGKFGTAPFEVRAIGDDEWTKADFTGTFAGVAGMSPSLKPWTHQKRRASESPLDTVDPTQLLRTLTKQGTTLSTTSDGDRTTTVLRIPEAALGSSLGTGSKDVDLTIQSDADGRIRLLRYDADSSGFGTLRATLAYDDFGVDVHVSPPPADQVQESPSIPTGGVHTQQHFSTTVGSSPADRKRACDMVKQFQQTAPTPTTPEQKAGYDQFLAIAKKACAPK